MRPSGLECRFIFFRIISFIYCWCLWWYCTKGIYCKLQKYTCLVYRIMHQRFLFLPCEWHQGKSCPRLPLLKLRHIPTFPVILVSWFLYFLNQRTDRWNQIRPGIELTWWQTVPDVLREAHLKTNKYKLMCVHEFFKWKIYTVKVRTLFKLCLFTSDINSRWTLPTRSSQGREGIFRSIIQDFVSNFGRPSATTRSKMLLH